MCRLLKVSRSGYYAWRVRPESQRAKRDRELTRVIRRLHADSDGVYGAPKMCAELHDEGYPCGRHKVARLMRIAGLNGCPKRRFLDELDKHGIQCSMSARGNCYDNAVVESFFGLLKRERVNRTRYLTRDEAKADVFDYIERFYNRKRRHGYLGNISPAAFEERNQNQFQAVH